MTISTHLLAAGVLMAAITSAPALAGCMDSLALYKQSSRERAAYQLSHHDRGQLLAVTPVATVAETSEQQSLTQGCAFDPQRLTLVLHYPLDGFQLSLEHKQALLELLVMVEQEGKLGIGVAGHADRLGSSGYNLGLSRRRSGAVAEFIAEVRPDLHLESVGYGEGSPVCSSADNDKLGCNRRVEVRLLL
ncbi:Outer membrane protein OmpA [Ferrimonas sediminum]|uniref:Outer membrane protein OmpA n=1 Tax=Ferrimonas sediminum TaxID=718193 RepID=A0A1G8NGL1_9GAMM|nr:OmpA family protein [Ferrimonas sediminum]SDI79282.1 Outer membrane protein OmpA [Ferrimonas sediminum]